MKKYLCILILLIFFSGYTQEKLSQKQSIELINKVDSLQKKVAKLENKSESLDVLQEYKNLNNLYSIGFGILLALFGIVFPMIIYMVQIKPSLDAIKETKALIKKVDDDFEKSFEKHLKKNKNKLIDRALESFLNQSTHNLPTNYTLLDSYKSEGFTELQVVKLLKIIKNADTNTEEFIADLLTFQEDTNTEDYFVNVIKNNPEDHKCIFAATYFANYNKREYIDLIAESIRKGQLLSLVIPTLTHSSKKFTLELMNNEILVNDPDLVEEIIDWGSSAKYAKDSLGKSQIESTLLWKKYLEVT